MNSRAIYPESFARNLPYTCSLITSKLLKCLGIYLSYDLLKSVHVVPFLFLVHVFSALPFLLLQKPFSNGKHLTKNEWLKIFRYSLGNVLINVLWMFGLTQCGPLRTLLLYEHSSIVVLALLSALFTNSGSPAKLRGGVFFVIAAFGLLAFDHDDMREHAAKHGDDHQHSGVVSHLFEHLTHWTGLSDHKGGVMLLLLTLCARTGYESYSRKLAVEVGGTKRLRALISFFSAAWMLPWTLFNLTFSSEIEVSFFSLIIPCLFVAIFVFVIDYYVENLSIQKLETHRCARISMFTTVFVALVIGAFWKNSYQSFTDSSKNLVITEDHQMSGGVVFSVVLFLFATQILTEPSRTTRGSFIGYSPAGMPLYNLSGDAFHRTSSSLLLIAKNGLRQILEESDSRKIFYFLCLNLSFTFIELIYGAWTNSLGLISDGFHMLFDCSALVMGLYAAVMSRWAPTRTFSYGFDRVEILSGFINGLFLVVVAFFVFSEAVGRLFDPPEIRTERLLSVAVAGLIVNLLGIMAFSHGHTHSHGGGGSHGHGHSHGGHGQNTNMRGVFLHVLADTLGSVGVIVSSILIENFGWNIADPLCSLFIAIMIFVSVLPLLKDSSCILLLQAPSDLGEDIESKFKKVLYVEGVLGYRNEHIWRHSTNVLAATIHVQISPQASEQKVLLQVTSLLKELGVTNIAIQIEKETFFQHLAGLGKSLEEVKQMAKSVKTLKEAGTKHIVNSI